ncbi:MAG: hypothetical protein V4449_01430 [Patescibacteria group bacterium]
MTAKPILGVDFDDVLVRTGNALAEFHNATYGTTYSRDDVSSFHLHEVWNCTPEEARARIDEFISTEFHHNSEAVLGAYDALKQLSQTYEIVIVTGRMHVWRDKTIEWLEKNFLGLYREIHFTNHDDPDPSKRRLKSEFVTELGISLFIDDALKFATDVASVGVPVLLFDTPWNQGEVPPGVTRVHSWDEILRTLASKETGK